MRLDRRAKIKLLLRTLLDATSPGRGTSDVRAAFGSRPPARSAIWAEGSYQQLWRCLDEMKTPYPKIHRHIVAFYVDPAPWARKSVAEKGIELLDRRMPANVFVPQEISENAGFLPGEAKTGAKPRERIAA